MVFFHFCSIFKRNFCLQTVGNLIRCHILRRLIWFLHCLPMLTKRALGLYGLKALVYLSPKICYIVYTSFDFIIFLTYRTAKIQLGSGQMHDPIWTSTDWTCLMEHSTIHNSIYSLLSIPRIPGDWAKCVELSVVQGYQFMA